MDGVGKGLDKGVRRVFGWLRLSTYLSYCMSE